MTYFSCGVLQEGKLRVEPFRVTAASRPRVCEERPSDDDAPVRNLTLSSAPHSFYFGIGYRSGGSSSVY